MTNQYATPDIELLRLTTAGSVDDGKSTLIGRLLHDCNAIFEDQFASLKNMSEKRGMKEPDLSLLLDGLSAEREQGITIDVAYRYFATPKRRFIIADTPGHEQYTRNMVTGASTANLALILVDARKGMLEQSKRHLFIASLLGIPHIAIIVNKMDLVGYDQKIFEKIKKQFLEFLTRLNIVDVRFIPISALKGDMVVERRENLTWYDDAPLLYYLENVQIISDRNMIDFRFPIQLVLRHNQDFRGYAGKVEGGRITVGELIKVLPGGQETRIKEVLYNEKKQKEAFESQSVVITLEDEIDASRGDMIVRKNNIPEIGNELEAMVCWMDEEPLELNKSYIIKQTTKVTRCYVDDLKYRININNLHREETKSLKFNEIGRVSISANELLMFDTYKKNRNTGSFILIDQITNNTVGAGCILDKGKNVDDVHKIKTLKTKKSGVLWFTGLSGSGKTTIADKIYKIFIKKGIACERLDGDIMRESLSKDLGFSKEDRDVNIERAAFVARLLSRNGVWVVGTFISPYKKHRSHVRNQVENYIEIFVNTPLEICEKRDVKGLYKKARSGEIKNFTGISDPYEKPKNPDIEINTGKDTSDEAVSHIIHYLIDNGYLKNE